MIYQLFLLDLMGSLCITKVPTLLEQKPSEEDGHSRQSIKFTDAETTRSLQLDFTGQKLIHLSADLLILFMDQSVNIKKNDHFIKLPMQGSKLEEYVHSHLEKMRLNEEQNERQFITIPIMIPTLNFKRVGIIFCEAWNADKNDKTNLEILVKKYLQSLRQQEIGTMIITEFISEIGVPLQKGARILAKYIVAMPKKPQKIIFCCLTDESKQVFMDVFKANKEDIELTEYSVTGSFAKSDYY